MKVLILSHNTGGGHISVANALKEEFEKNNIDCCLAYSNISVKEVRNTDDKKNSWNYIVKVMPIVAKFIYIVGNIYDDLNIIPSKSIVYGYNKIYAKNLNKYIDDNNFDMIIATHMFPGQTLTFLKNRKNKNIHFIVINTDYFYIPLQNELDSDYYVIATKDLEKEFIKMGINKKKLLSTGIPVSSKFNNKLKKEQSRTNLNLPLDKKIILIMNGSLGYGNVNKYIDKMYKYYGDDIYIIVMCAKNVRLKLRLNRNYKNNFEALGFKNNVNEYMKACDVLITKPGGISITEAAIMNIPIILTNPIPGGEEVNLKYFVEHNMACSARNPRKLIRCLDSIFENKKVVSKMIKKQSKYINKNSSSDLVKFIIKKYSK